MQGVRFVAECGLLFAVVACSMLSMLLLLVVAVRCCCLSSLLFVWGVLIAVVCCVLCLFPRSLVAFHCLSYVAVCLVFTRYVCLVVVGGCCIEVCWLLLFVWCSLIGAA